MAESVGGITVVVPIYGDPPSVLSCLRALAGTAFGERDRVLIVNDCGPEADELERLVAPFVDDAAHWSYARNPRNLGFVGACNRAALELDETDNDILLLNSDTEPRGEWLSELRRAFAEHPEVGTIAPRSNSAGLATFPPTAHPLEPDSAAELHAHIAAQLPAVTLSPTAPGFCLLIRRQLIAAHGLFDDTFAPGYGEENDFCRRMLGHGFRSALANRAWVGHEGSKSFTVVRRNRLAERHEAILRARHPEYWPDVVRFQFAGRHPLDRFAAADLGDTPTVVVYGDRRARAELSRIANILRGSASVTISVPAREVPLTRLRFRGVEVVAHGDEVSRIWSYAAVARHHPDLSARAAWSAPRLLDRATLTAGAQAGSLDLPRAPWDVDAVAARMAEALGALRESAPTAWLPAPSLPQRSARAVRRAVASLLRRRPG